MNYPNPSAATDQVTTAAPHPCRWSLSQITELFEQPLMDLVYRAQTVHRENFTPNQVQLSSLLSIKTGACSEDCSYCSQSIRYQTGIEVEKLLPLDDIVDAAKRARQQGSSRFCMGAAWRGLKDRDVDHIAEAVRRVKALGMETCVTLGALSNTQAQRLKQAGLDYYNHNLDTSEEYYSQIVSTHSFEDRLNTLQNVRNADINVCAGGIIGMGESRDDRAGLIGALANLPTPPRSVPINMLVPIPGTPLQDVQRVDPFEFVKTIAVARITMPQSYVRLSAGRSEMSDECQALCFLAGANSIFYGDELLTTSNASVEHDQELFRRLDVEIEKPPA